MNNKRLFEPHMDISGSQNFFLKEFTWHTVKILKDVYLDGDDSKTLSRCAYQNRKKRRSPLNRY